MIPDKDGMYHFDFKMDGIDAENLFHLINGDRCKQLSLILKCMGAKDTGYLYNHVYTVQGCFDWIEYMDEMETLIFGEEVHTACGRDDPEMKQYYYIPPETET